MTQDSGKSCSSWLMPQKYKLNQYLNICSLFDQVGPPHYSLRGQGGPSSITAIGSLVVRRGGRASTTNAYHFRYLGKFSQLKINGRKIFSEKSWTQLLVSFNVSSLHRLRLTSPHKRENRKIPWLHLPLVRAESSLEEFEGVNDSLVINSVEMSWLRKCAEVCGGSDWRTGGQ